MGVFVCIRACSCDTYKFSCYRFIEFATKLFFLDFQVTPSIFMWRCSTVRSNLTNWRFLMVHIFFFSLSFCVNFFFLINCILKKNIHMQSAFAFFGFKESCDYKIHKLKILVKSDRIRMI